MPYHKYITKKWQNGRWVYQYNENPNSKASKLRAEYNSAVKERHDTNREHNSTVKKYYKEMYISPKLQTAKDFDTKRKQALAEGRIDDAGMYYEAEREAMSEAISIKEKVSKLYIDNTKSVNEIYLKGEANQAAARNLIDRVGYMTVNALNKAANKKPAKPSNDTNPTTTSRTKYVSGHAKAPVRRRSNLSVAEQTYKKYFSHVDSNGVVLIHHGTKGMHWHQRLYQYPDGSLTPLGKLRYRKNKNGVTVASTKPSHNSSDGNSSEQPATKKMETPEVSTEKQTPKTETKQNPQNATTYVNSRALALKAIEDMSDKEVEALRNRLNNEKLIADLLKSNESKSVINQYKTADEMTDAELKSSVERFANKEKYEKAVKDLAKRNEPAEKFIKRFSKVTRSKIEDVLITQGSQFATDVVTGFFEGLAQELSKAL